MCVLAKKCAKITQTYIRETPYHSIKLHLKQAFRSIYRHEFETDYPTHRGRKKYPR